MCSLGDTSSWTVGTLAIPLWCHRLRRTRPAAGGHRYQKLAACWAVDNLPHKPALGFDTEFSAGKSGGRLPASILRPDIIEIDQAIPIIDLHTKLHQRWNPQNPRHLRTV